MVYQRDTKEDRVVGKIAQTVCCIFVAIIAAIFAVWAVRSGDGVGD